MQRQLFPGIDGYRILYICTDSLHILDSYLDSTFYCSFMGRRKPPKDSLAALAEAGRAYFIQCDACLHYKRLNFYDIATRIGWGATTREIIAKHRCAKCGEKRASIRSE
jgi:hypothetical protein